MKKKIASIIGLCAMLAVASQIIYCQWIFREQTTGAPTCDTVLVYGGGYNRSVQGLNLANKARVPLFISDSFGDQNDVEKKIGPSLVPITVDHFARTTDQNARNAVAFLRKGNYRKAALATNWYHMPRALFLTRLYLIGSGIEVRPYFFESNPSNVYVYPDFWAEIIRFWGSMGRVGLALLGFEKPWFHS